VDDIDGVKIKDGDVVSLSGALPGICGIAMSRDTVISGFRSDISAKPSDAIRKGDALVHVKLFNLVASEAGATLLEKGVIAEAEDIVKTLKGNAPEGLTSNDGTILLTYLDKRQNSPLESSIREGIFAFCLLIITCLTI